MTDNKVDVTQRFDFTTEIEREMMRREIATEQARYPDVIPEFQEHRYIYGKPGASLLSAPFSTDNVLRGAVGECRTAAILRVFAQTVPKTYVYHDVLYPGSPNANVDHAVLLNGYVVNKGLRDVIVLVDSKMWKPSTYEWVVAEKLRDKATDAVHDFETLKAAVRKYRTAYPSAIVLGLVSLVDALGPVEGTYNADTWLASSSGVIAVRGQELPLALLSLLDRRFPTLPTSNPSPETFHKNLLRP